MILAVRLLNYISSVIICAIRNNASLCEVKCLYILHSVNVSSTMFLETMDLPSFFTNLEGVKTEWAIQSPQYKFIWISGKQMFIKFAITWIVRQCKYLKCYSCTTKRWQTCRTNTFFNWHISVKEKIILISLPLFKIETHFCLCSWSEKRNTLWKQRHVFSSQV